MVLLKSSFSQRYSRKIRTSSRKRIFKKNHFVRFDGGPDARWVRLMKINRGRKSSDTAPLKTIRYKFNLLSVVTIIGRYFA